MIFDFSLIFYGALSTMVGVLIGAYVQSYYTQRHLLQEAQKLMHEEIMEKSKDDD